MMQSREMLEMPSHSSRHPLYDMIYKSVGRNSDAIGEMLRVQRKKLRFLDADETASLLRIMRIIRNLPRCRR